MEITTCEVAAESGDGVSGFVENAKLIPEGTPEEVNVTGLVKLFHDWTVATTDIGDDSGDICIELGVIESVKFGQSGGQTLGLGVTTRVTAVVCMVAFPVIVKV